MRGQVSLGACSKPSLTLLTKREKGGVSRSGLGRGAKLPMTFKVFLEAPLQAEGLFSLVKNFSCLSFSWFRAALPGEGHHRPLMGPQRSRRLSHDWTRPRHASGPHLVALFSPS